MKRLIDGRELVIFEHGVNERNFFDAERRDIADGVVLDFAVFTIGLAKQIGRRRLAVRNAGDMHDFVPKKKKQCP